MYLIKSCCTVDVAVFMYVLCLWDQVALEEFYFLQLYNIKRIKFSFDIFDVFDFVYRFSELSVDTFIFANMFHCFSDAGKMTTKSYESDTFMQEMEATWQGLKPLYEQVTE